MPRRTRSARRRRVELTLDRELDLTIGPLPKLRDGSDDEQEFEDLREVWFAHRERLLEADPDCWGYCEFEGDPEHPPWRIGLREVAAEKVGSG